MTTFWWVINKTISYKLHLTLGTMCNPATVLSQRKKYIS